MTCSITRQQIEKLRNELCDLDPWLAQDLGVCDGFEVPDDQEERQFLVDDLNEALDEAEGGAS